MPAGRSVSSVSLWGEPRYSMPMMVVVVMMVVHMRACHGWHGDGGKNDEGDETAHEMLP